ncbi:hypothetical protein KAR91_21095 [Candidatus Pacearchaeota archaeon]|nr:hypothetical protein [Candidatus Pacearchaeota archaeon]
MEKNIIIRNTSNQPRLFTFTHQEVCLKAGKCFCEKKVPLSIHVLVDSETPTYSAAALRSSDIQAAALERKIAIIPIEKATGRPARPKGGQTKSKRGKVGKGKG